MKLKTLKEVQEFSVGDRLDFVFIHKLKAEAIKWAKKWRMRPEFHPFCKFFNITEEDLK